MTTSLLLHLFFCVQIINAITKGAAQTQVSSSDVIQDSFMADETSNDIGADIGNLPRDSIINAGKLYKYKFKNTDVKIFCISHLSFNVKASLHGCWLFFATTTSSVCEGCCVTKN